MTIALSIATYEASPEVNAFSSKYDLTFRGQAKLTKQEQKGYALFRGKGMCHRCHTSNGQRPCSQIILPRRKKLFEIDLS